MTNPNRNVTMLDDAPASQASAPAQLEGQQISTRFDDTLSGKRKLLTIHPASGVEGGEQAVFVGLNEVAYLIPRGTTWNVPAEVVEVLEHGQTTTYTRSDNGQAVARSGLRVPFSVSDAPDLDPKEALRQQQAAKRAKQSA